MLRLASEHREAGLHVVLEIVARGEHPADEAAARIVIGGRIQEFEPLPDEEAEAYRRRVEPLTTDAGRLEAHRRQFESFVDRVADAIRAAMPEARVQIRNAEAQVKKPSRKREVPAPPTSPTYDPYGHYYPSPLDSLLSMMMWSSLFSMAFRPDVVVVDHHGDAIGSAHDIDQAAGQDHDGFVADTSGEEQHGDFGNAESDYDGGGDFDGGDFGGDFGGGDF
jgi:hypothetical protein